MNGACPIHALTPRRADYPNNRQHRNRWWHFGASLMGELRRTTQSSRWCLQKRQRRLAEISPEIVEIVTSSDRFLPLLPSLLIEL